MFAELEARLINNLENEFKKFEGYDPTIETDIPFCCRIIAAPNMAIYYLDSPYNEDAIHALAIEVFHYLFNWYLTNNSEFKQNVHTIKEYSQEIIDDICSIHPYYQLCIYNLLDYQIHVGVNKNKQLDELLESLNTAPEHIWPVDTNAELLFCQDAIKFNVEIKKMDGILFDKNGCNPAEKRQLLADAIMNDPKIDQQKFKREVDSKYRVYIVRGRFNISIDYNKLRAYIISKQK